MVAVLAEACTQIRQNAHQNAAVLTRLLHVLQLVAERALSLKRKVEIFNQAAQVGETGTRTMYLPRDNAIFSGYPEEVLSKLKKLIESGT